MKVLLTGKNRSGKTTLLKSLIDAEKSTRGLMTVEVRNELDRIGFNLQDDQGNTTVLARVDVVTPYAVGRYYVDSAALDAFVEPLFKFKPRELLFIDEIGHMQLYSSSFMKLTDTYLNSQNDFIGTISSIYEHPLIRDITLRSDVILCTVTPENRESLSIFLRAALTCRRRFNRLSQQQQQFVVGLARGYLQHEQYSSLKKLFGNAIRYLDEHRVEKEVGGDFVILGDHNKHRVAEKGQGFTCDCDLFNGRGQFKNNAGECSHIQSVKLSMVM